MYFTSVISHFERFRLNAKSQRKQLLFSCCVHAWSIFSFCFLLLIFPFLAIFSFSSNVPYFWRMETNRKTMSYQRNATHCTHDAGSHKTTRLHRHSNMESDSDTGRKGEDHLCQRLDQPSRVFKMMHCHASTQSSVTNLSTLAVSQERNIATR